jgi:hypothetical protein
VLRPCKEHIRKRPKKPRRKEKGVLCVRKKGEIMCDKRGVSQNGYQKRVVCRSGTTRYRSRGLPVRL